MHVAGHRHIATATLAVKGGVIRDSCEADSMYASLDGIGHKISRKLRELKEKRRNMKHFNTDEYTILREVTMTS